MEKIREEEKNNKLAHLYGLGIVIREELVKKLTPKMWEKVNKLIEIELQIEKECNQ